VTERRPALVDGALYASSALVAAGVWLLADIPIQRTWGRIALVPYAAGALLAILLAVRGTPSTRWRALLALLVFVAVALLPMALEVARRSRTDPGLHAQSEVIVTEEAAKAARHGRDPYDVDYLEGPLRDRPLGTRTHFPYLPGMLLFGLPRAVGGSGGLSDARIPFAAATLVLAGLALWRERSTGSGKRFRVAQILFVMPTGALLMAVGGDDLPVLALMLLAVVLARKGEATWSGLALGWAAATKQTAWLLIPLLIPAMRDRAGRPAWRRGAVAAASVVLAGVLPFLLWSPGAFVEDVVKFPLGLGRQRTAAGTPTLGSWLVDAFPSARVGLTLALVIAIMAAGAALLLRGVRRTPREAVRAAGILLVVALLLAPAGRIGYLIYPVNLLAWSWLLGAGAPASPASTHGADAAPTGRRDEQTTGG
jgi:hypothetical protein